jgi:hypothetical protein
MAGEGENTRPSSGGLIFYCEQCGQRIPPADFQNKSARLSSDNLACCAKCAAKQPNAARAANPEPVIKAESFSAPSRPPARRKDPQKAPPPLNMNLIFGGVGALVLIVGLFLVTRGGKDSAPVASDTPPAKKDSAPSVTPPVAADKPVLKTPPLLNSPAPQNPPVTQPAPVAGTTERAPARPLMPPTEEYDPRKAVSESMLAQAKDYNQKNPGDLYGYVDKLEQLRDRYRTTAAGEEARKLLSEIKLPEHDSNTNPAPPVDDDFKQAMSVLPLVKPEVDAKRGSWSTANGNLRSDKSMWSKLETPFILPEEYDLRVSFTRVENDDCLLVTLARRGKPFCFSIGGAGNTGCSFEVVTEKRKDRVSANIKRPGVLTSGIRNQVVIQVRKECLRAYLNGKLIVGCQVDDSGLSAPADFQNSQPNQMGLMTWNSVYEFHSLEVRPISGEGKVLR